MIKKNHSDLTQLYYIKKTKKFSLFFFNAAAEIILNEIKAETEIGVQMSGKLMRGESLSTNFVTELIQ